MDLSRRHAGLMIASARHSDRCNYRDRTSCRGAPRERLLTSLIAIKIDSARCNRASTSESECGPRTPPPPSAFFASRIHRYRYRAMTVQTSLSESHSLARFTIRARRYRGAIGRVAAFSVRGPRKDIDSYSRRPDLGRYRLEQVSSSADWKDLVLRENNPRKESERGISRD